MTLDSLKIQCAEVESQVSRSQKRILEIERERFSEVDLPLKPDTDAAYENALAAENAELRYAEEKYSRYLADIARTEADRERERLTRINYWLMAVSILSALAAWYGAILGK